MEIQFDWELVSSISSENGLYQTERAKVIGGWIIRSTSFLGDDPDSDNWKNISESMVFIPDPLHEWNFE